MLRLSALLLLLTASPPVVADRAYTSLKFLHDCTAAMPDGGAPIANTPSSERCFGMMDAIIEFSIILESRKGPKALMFCLPGHVTSEQAIRVALKHIAAQPERLHNLATGAIVAALVAAYPCP